MSESLIIPRSAKKKLTPEQLKKMKEQDHRMVKGIFRCMEPPGGSVTFSYKKYAGDPVEKYTMADGKVYTVPLMVAKHINNHCTYDIHQHTLDLDGNPRVDVGKRVKRFSFESLDFMDIEEDEQ
jgi:hypothetical protein